MKLPPFTRVEKEFEVIHLKPNEPVDLRGYDTPVSELRPIRLYILPHGAKDDSKSYVVEMIGSGPMQVSYFAQISHKMLMAGLNEAGVKL